MTRALPHFLVGRMTPEQYHAWLTKQTDSIWEREGEAVRRGRLDRRRYLTREALQHALHMQMLRSDGNDSYTGGRLSWRLAVESLDPEWRARRKRDDGRQTMRELAALPTFDHRRGLRGRSFRLCGAATNHAKCYLSEREFVLLCTAVARHRGTLLAPAPETAPSKSDPATSGAGPRAGADPTP